MDNVTVNGLTVSLDGATVTLSNNDSTITSFNLDKQLTISGDHTLTSSIDVKTGGTLSISASTTLAGTLKYTAGTITNNGTSKRGASGGNGSVQILQIL